MSITILLADDHRILRESLRRVLDEEADMEVIAEANNGLEAINLAKKVKPDVVLMDISMPKLNGIEASREIIQKLPSVKILILSMHSNKQFVEDTFKSGISGYLLKNCAISEVVLAIKTILEGKYYISPDIASVVIDDLVHSISSKEKSRNELTLREKEILRYISDGQTTPQIANSLYLSDKTVEVHRKHIMQKMECHNLVELIKKAIQKGLITIEDEQ